MPDTKSGREKKGRNKRAQLDAHLVKRELEAEDREEPPRPTDPDRLFEG